MNEQNRKYKGFTLKELLMIIAIIGILASVITVSLAALRKKSRDAAIIAMVDSMMNTAQANGLLETSDKYKKFLVNGGNGSEGEHFLNESDCLNLNDDIGVPPSYISACQKIIKTLGNDSCTSCRVSKLFIGNWNEIGYAWISIIAYLPQKNKLYCVNSNGQRSFCSNTLCPGCVK